MGLIFSPKGIRIFCKRQVARLYYADVATKYLSYLIFVDHLYIISALGSYWAIFYLKGIRM